MEKVHKVNEFRCHALSSESYRKMPCWMTSSQKLQQCILNKRSGKLSDSRLQYSLLKYLRESFCTPVTSNMKNQTPGVSEATE